MLTAPSPVVTAKTFIGEINNIAINNNENINLIFFIVIFPPFLYVYYNNNFI